MKAYIIHENDEWTQPLKEQLQKLSVPFEDWHMAKVNLNTASIPPNGVFYNRMSASSHSRGHRFAPEYTAVILNWLSFHNRRIINGENALALEISKSLQYKKLNEQNIKTPKSIFCSGKANILSRQIILLNPSSLSTIELDVVLASSYFKIKLNLKNMSKEINLKIQLMVLQFYKIILKRIQK